MAKNAWVLRPWIDMVLFCLFQHANGWKAA